MATDKLVEYFFGVHTQGRTRTIYGGTKWHKGACVLPV
jgi:hypothetical protein